MRGPLGHPQEARTTLYRAASTGLPRGHRLALAALLGLALLGMACANQTTQQPSVGPGSAGQPYVGQTAGGGSEGALTGTWKGTYKSEVYSQIKGTFSVEITQSGQDLTGSISIAQSPCVSQGTISGSVEGLMIDFGAVQAERNISFTGTVTGNSMSGTFDAPDCGPDHGTWSATRT